MIILNDKEISLSRKNSNFTRLLMSLLKVFHVDEATTERLLIEDKSTVVYLNISKYLLY